MKPLRSLQARLLALVLATVSVVWLAAAIITWRDAQHELDELLELAAVGIEELTAAQREAADAPRPE